MSIVYLTESETDVTMKALIQRSQSIDFQLAEFTRHEHKLSTYKTLVNEQAQCELIIYKLLENDPNKSNKLLEDKEVSL